MTRAFPTSKLESATNNCRLADVVNSPMADELNKLIPFESTDHVANELAFGVQLNIFECGGIAIGLSTSHRLGDGLSMIMFAKNWAAIARGHHDHNEDQMKLERPEFVSASLFPPKESTGLFDPNSAIAKTKVTKRFVFDASTIDDLRAKYASSLENDQKRPSRVVVLLAFIRRRIMEATKDDENTLHMVVHTLNLRPKFDPPLPRSSFGNIFHTFLTTCSLSSNSCGDDQETCHDMVRQVGEEINKIDKDYVTRIQHGDEYLSFTDRLIRSYTRSGKVVLSSCSSLCRFPLYESDFGWGRPTWVGVAALPVKNLIVLVDTKEVGGIEAYVSLADQDTMTKFESDAFLQRRVGKNRVGSAGSNLTHQPATLSQVWNSQTEIDQVNVQVHAKL